MELLEKLQKNEDSIIANLLVGHVIVDNKGGGVCGYRAIAYLLWGDERKWKKAKSWIHSEMSGPNRKEYEAFFAQASHDCYDDSTFEAYLHNFMGDDSYQLNELELSAAAYAFDRIFAVFDATKSMEPIWYPDDEEEIAKNFENSPQVILLRTGGHVDQNSGHWQAVVSEEDEEEDEDEDEAEAENENEDGEDDDDYHGDDDKSKKSGLSIDTSGMFFGYYL